MRPVADPVHESECGTGQGSLHAVIFNNDGVTGHAFGFAEEDHRIVGVMQDIHEDEGIGAAIGLRDGPSVKEAYGNGGLGADSHFATFNADGGGKLHDASGQGTVATADIQDAPAGLEHGRHRGGDGAHAPSVDEFAVHRADGSRGEVGGVRGHSTNETI